MKKGLKIKISLEKIILIYIIIQNAFDYNNKGFKSINHGIIVTFLIYKKIKF